MAAGFPRSVRARSRGHPSPPMAVPCRPFGGAASRASFGDAFACVAPPRRSLNPAIPYCSRSSRFACHFLCLKSPCRKLKKPAVCKETTGRRGTTLLGFAACAAKPPHPDERLPIGIGDAGCGFLPVRARSRGHPSPPMAVPCRPFGGAAPRRASGFRRLRCTVPQLSGVQDGPYCSCSARLHRSVVARRRPPSGRLPTD